MRKQPNLRWKIWLRWLLGGHLFGAASGFCGGQTGGRKLRLLGDISEQQAAVSGGLRKIEDVIGRASTVYYLIALQWEMMDMEEMDMQKMDLQKMDMEEIDLQKMDLAEDGSAKDGYGKDGSGGRSRSLRNEITLLMKGYGIVFRACTAEIGKNR
ncbi:MAG: hypothetical protein K2L17_05340 [Muribaculaceae bacterium]|nr:hypothetical protein [Muribaculaceae bacterium]